MASMMTDPKSLLPWHANKTLTASERASVARLLAEDAGARQQLVIFEHLNETVQRQPQTAVPIKVRRQVLEHIQEPNWQQSANQIAGTMILAFITLVLLWGLIQPGITLRWSASGEDVATFRVYRVDSHEFQFVLVDEVPTQPGNHEYQTIDSILLPGDNIEYVVEGIDQNGNTLQQQIAVGAALPTLLSQLALMVCSLAVAAVGLMIARFHLLHLPWIANQLWH